IDTIEPGLDFVEVIEKAVGSCDVLIAVIGRQWLTVTDATGQRRLDHPEDFVRLEIKTALDRNIRVIPALLPGATMPRSQDLPDVLKKLARRNAIAISPRFHPEASWLIEVVEKMLGSASGSALSKPEPIRQMEKKEVFEPALILIPAGEFLMGSDPKVDKYARDNEQPQHRLYLPAYYIAKTPVTNAHYALFVQATQHRPPQNWTGKEPPKSEKYHPVVYVSWKDAAAYCRWLAHVTGKPYRLPTEAEWEKAARGTDGRIYPWGNERNASRCNTYESGKSATTPVGSYPSGASPYGVLDMAGNGWEWCATKRDKPYPYNATEDEWAANYLKDKAARVLRGGAFNFSGSYARCAFRGRLDLDGWYDCIGFRVVSPIL
ncbi:MAG TPA: SUMF1/EgtB/PvdO family nonheme iron enzyme, partial [Anaerolineae bacterium]|nr:SUMF1/EgtB/PvdO family nonheme iron enzyme [Anaerolineae bacterium]